MLHLVFAWRRFEQKTCLIFWQGQFYIFVLFYFFIFFQFFHFFFLFVVVVFLLIIIILTSYLTQSRVHELQIFLSMLPCYATVDSVIISFNIRI